MTTTWHNKEMRRCSNLADRMPAPDFFVDTLHEGHRASLGQLEAYDPDAKKELEYWIGEPQVSDSLEFTASGDPVDMRWLLDRFTDTTGGQDPGNPSAQVHTPWHIKDKGRTTDSTDEARLERFFTRANVQPRIATQAYGNRGEFMWYGSAYKEKAAIFVPERIVNGRAFLHELGHCVMGRVGYEVDFRTWLNDPNTGDYEINKRYNWLTSGLRYVADDGDDDTLTNRGALLEEAVAEGWGILVNKRLGLIRSHHNGPALPEKLKSYIIDGRHLVAAPSGLALELIADQLGLTIERFLGMFANYANIGVHQIDARQEIAEAIYKGTNGKLTLDQIEGLPYPASPRSGLALLWAVETALDTPDHQAYSQHFFRP